MTERRYAVTEVAQQLGISSHSLYAWLRGRGVSRATSEVQEHADLQRENACLHAKLHRIEGERNILRKVAAYFSKR